MIELYERRGTEINKMQMSERGSDEENEYKRHEYGILVGILNSLYHIEVIRTRREGNNYRIKAIYNDKEQINIQDNVQFIMQENSMFNDDMNKREFEKKEIEYISDILSEWGYIFIPGNVSVSTDVSFVCVVHKNKVYTKKMIKYIGNKVNKSIKEMLADCPYETVVIMKNDSSVKSIMSLLH